MKLLEFFNGGCKNKVYLIAEIGLNHGGSINRAREMIASAAKTGVDAVKFQTYLTEKRVPRSSPLSAILKKCELPFEAFKELKACSNEFGLDFFSTAFDSESVAYLESIGCPAYKVASFDVPNCQLLRRIAETGKPVVMSVGMSTMPEIETAFKILSQETKNIALLYCVSSYPMAEADANLSAIKVLSEKFRCIVGYSDHSNGARVALFSVAAGARIIEKHYRINEVMDCIDAPVSITQEQMKELVSGTRRLEQMLGNGSLGLHRSERDCAGFRRITS